MVRRLPGRTLSLLGVGPENYWHWMMDGLGRLAADPGAVEACRHVLVPSLTRDFQTAGLAAAGIDHTALVEMEIGDTVEAEHLVVPWTNIGDFAAHPCLGAWFAGPFVARLGVGPVRERVRLYLDRTAGRNRRLVNEAAVIDALAPLGFTAVRPEAMTLAAQASLFARAECVVAPHGAGLTNLLFAPPGCAVLELHMDAYVHWCFHRLAALLGQRYECVIGRALGPHDANPHARSWSVSPMHVRAAVETMLAADTTAPG
jgi:capsular polysaccharide biosynthesis protein